MTKFWEFMRAIVALMLKDDTYESDKARGLFHD